MSGRLAALLALTLSPTLACNQQPGGGNHARSEGVASASQEMSGPSLFSSEVLGAGVQALRARADDKWLRLEVTPHELVLQAEDPSRPGAVLEYHYRDGKVGEPEHAALRGKGRLADNLFDVAEVKLDSIPLLARESVRRVDPDGGAVERVLVRRNLPESTEVMLRVYVSSPRFSGHVDADHAGRLLGSGPI